MYESFSHNVSQARHNWNGYRRIDNQSKKAVQWMYWMAYKNKIHIQKSENGREYRLPINIKVDGYCESTNTVFEFLGNFSPFIFCLLNI